MLKLANKVAVITGAGSGIGRAIAQLFGKEGAFVHIVDLNKDDAQKVADELIAAGGKAQAHGCNVVEQHELLAIAAEIGDVDILVNNAGVAHVGNLENCTEADFERVFQVNVKGAYNALYAFIPGMKARQQGAILNMASIAALVGITDRFAYSMSKGAIYAMNLSVARDYMAYNIRSNSISPARVHTPFVDGFISKNYPGQEEEMFAKLSASQPIGRMAQPEEIAKLALFLCSDDAQFITGNDYPIDGGFIKLNN
ncbi:SDR family NAD(P)-dependent oxidoreductase [Sphingobacterium sp. MYb382]|uniref:SDR family NAD(P)-dependent oxidoreductase n=1 Tax=Sphingobacterium sp. MYb382 TaxID=2745278 RepID=UPI0030B0CC31